MFYFEEFEGKKILKSSLLSDYDCFFTTREFVLTPKDRPDLNNEALLNREILKNKLNVKDIITANQVHSDNISIINDDNTFYDNTDALISNIPDTLFIMNFADCVPIILYDKTTNSGGIIHAGWRGTASEISSKTVVKMKKEMGINPENITALIGPCIGKCCFETNEDVFNKLIADKKEYSIRNEEKTSDRINVSDKNNVYSKKGEKYYIDLKMLNENQLRKTGVENIDICSYCTCCMSDIFFSYRKEQGKTARHSAVVKIKRGQICQ